MDVGALLAHEIAFGVTVQHFLYFLGAAFVIGGILKFLGREKVENKVTARRCPSCQWRGPVGRQTRQCPRCKATLVGG